MHTVIPFDTSANARLGSLMNSFAAVAPPIKQEAVPTFLLVPSQVTMVLDLVAGDVPALPTFVICRLDVEKSTCSKLNRQSGVGNTTTIVLAAVALLPLTLAILQIGIIYLLYGSRLMSA